MASTKSYQPEKIIIRMPNWIGDFVMATPVLTDVRKAFPTSHITAMSRSPICDLLQESPDINELFHFSKTSRLGRRCERRNIIEKLRHGHYDLGILLTHSFSSAWLFWWGHVQRRLGYQHHWRSLLLTDGVKFPESVDAQHLVTTYKMLLCPLGVPISASKPRLYLAPKELEEARELLQRMRVPSHHALVGINPGATYGTAKCWLPNRFREVTERLLQDEHTSVIYFVDQSSFSLVKEICQGLPPRVVNLVGSTSLRQLAALIKLCDVLLTNDSGPMHVAAALETPVVALFGSTNDIITGPYQSGTVIHKHVECSPCFKRVCPIDFRCMKQIEADEVYTKILDYLKKTAHV